MCPSGGPRGSGLGGRSTKLFRFLLGVVDTSASRWPRRRVWVRGACVRPPLHLGSVPAASQTVYSLKVRVIEFEMMRVRGLFKCAYIRPACRPQALRPPPRAPPAHPTSALSSASSASSRVFLFTSSHHAFAELQFLLSTFSSLQTRLSSLALPCPATASSALRGECRLGLWIGPERPIRDFGRTFAQARREGRLSRDSYRPTPARLILSDGSRSFARDDD